MAGKHRLSVLILLLFRWQFNKDEANRRGRGQYLISTLEENQAIHGTPNDGFGLIEDQQTTEHRIITSSNSMESSLPSSVRLLGSSKRARARSSGRGGCGASQAVSCLVDGCKSDLTKCRDYHRRHKVCEQHSKTPRVTIAGLEQRFCQQCSRFHSLLEFDEGKRSCRKRLEGHNRRRRKPQSETRSVNPSTFLSAAQGSRFLPYNNDSSIIPAATSVVASSSTWSAGVKSEAGVSSSIYSRARSELSALPSTSYAWGKQFPFLHDSFSPHLPPPTSSTHQLFYDDLIPASGNGARGSNNPKDFFSAPASASALSSPNQVMNSDCALSLLSSSAPLETIEIGLGRMMQQPPNDRPLITGLSYNSFMGQFHHPQQQGLDIHGTSDGAASLISNVFQPASCDGPSSSAAHQMLSFSWAL